MNERIHELALQADTYAAAMCDMDENLDWYITRDQKFANLIVRECVKVMYDNAIERKVGLEIEKRPTYYAAAILEHFGAKE
jgi:hypothetical protein